MMKPEIIFWFWNSCYSFLIRIMLLLVAFCVSCILITLPWSFSVLSTPFSLSCLKDERKNIRVNIPFVEPSSNSNSSVFTFWDKLWGKTVQCFRGYSDLLSCSIRRECCYQTYRFNLKPEWNLKTKSFGFKHASRLIFGLWSKPSYVIPPASCLHAKLS